MVNNRRRNCFNKVNVERVNDLDERPHHPGANHPGVFGNEPLNGNGEIEEGELRFSVALPVGI